MPTAAVVFDLDGVLMDSEQRWNEANEALVRESAGMTPRSGDLMGG
jgi:beta-phosphoglucomutase-like phosphatase (HAD superfamily)